MDIRFKRKLLDKLCWYNNIKRPSTFSDILHYGFVTNVTNDKRLVFDWTKELLRQGLIEPVLDLKFSHDDYYTISFKGLWVCHQLNTGGL
jgi:hypothetical protein